MEQAPRVGLARKSLLWVAVETGGTTAVTLVTMLILARMIGPDEFGTAALVIGGVQFLNLFVEGLFHDGLIQNPDTDDNKFDAAFSLALIIATGIVGIGLVVAVAVQHMPWAGSAWLFVGASLSLPFSGALGIGNARMRRDMIFREVARAALGARLVGSLLGIGMAASGFGAWSLVSVTTCSAALQAVLLFGQSGWRPRLRSSFGILWPICRFALPYAAMHSLVALRLQGFLIMIADSMSLTAVGYINVAFRLTTTPLTILTSTFSNLGLPLLARHQASRPDLEQAFLALTRLALSMTVPAFVGLALSAEELVPFLLGAKWIAAVPLIQMLAFGAALTFLRFPASSMLRAMGYVRYSFVSSLFQLTVTLTAMALLRPLELQEAVWLWILPALLQLPLTIIVLCRASTISFRVIAAGMLPTLVATTAMTLVVAAVAEILQTAAPIFLLIGKVICGGVAVVLVLLIADRDFRAVVASIFCKG